MESLLPFPPLTRFDVVMWFLRVQLWLSLVASTTQLLTSLVLKLALPGVKLFFLVLRFGLTEVVSVLILLLFPAILALSVLGSTAPEPVASLLDVKPLVGRCVGLALFVGSLGQLALFFGELAYSFWTHDPSFSLARGTSRFYALPQLIGPTIGFFLGFALAFGPNIRDSLRAR